MKITLAQGENILFEARPEQRIFSMWIFTKVIPISLLASFISFYAALMLWVFFVLVPSGNRHMPFPAQLLDYLYIIVPFWLVATFIYYSRLRNTYIYYITDQRCIFEGGIFVRRLRSVPFHKITDVEINQNIIERFLDIFSLKIFTPGTGSVGVPGFEKAEIIFYGLKDPQKPAGIIQDIIKKYKATGE